MSDVEVSAESNELFFLNGDEYFYVVDDPSGAKIPSKIAARELLPPPSLLRSRDWGLAYASAHGGAAIGTIGSGSASTGSTDGGNNYATTNERTRRKRVAWTTGASAGSSAGFRCADSHLMRGDATGRGGFRVLLRFGLKTLPATWRAFFGIAVNGSVFPNQDPSANTNIIGIGKDAADSAWQIMTNDGTGTATKTALSTTDFPITTTPLFEIELYCPPGNGSNVTYWVRNISGQDANGNDTYSKVVTATVTTDLPATATGLRWHAWINNDVNASAAVLEFMRCYYEAYGV